MLNTGDTLQVVARKYDQTFRFRTEVQVLHASPSAVLGLGLPDRQVRRADGIRIRQDWSLEYLPLHEPYNIVSFFDTDGALLYHFCNVLSLTRLDETGLSYVDLDLDVVVRADGSFSVEDRDDFERNSRSMGYPSDMVTLALQSVRCLEELAHEQKHVFRCSRLEEARATLLELYGS